MSKHKTAEQKLHVRTPFRTNSKKAFSANQNQLAPTPPKGTNTNNQYR